MKTTRWTTTVVVVVVSLFVLLCALFVGLINSPSLSLFGLPVKSTAVDVAADACLSSSSSNFNHNGNNNNSQSRREYKWLPEAKHPCNIVRMTYDQVLETFGPLGVPPMHPQPLVIVATDTTATTTASSNNEQKESREEALQKFIEMTALSNITNVFPPNFTVTLSSSNSFSHHRRTLSFRQYLKELLQENGGGETLPDQLANETWYLFGETYTDEWQSLLLQHYPLPPCQACTRTRIVHGHDGINDSNNNDSSSDDAETETETPVALSFGIGNRGSGVQWHVHGPGFSQALHGRKHWVLYPTKPASFHPDQTSRHWMEYTYTSLQSNNKKELLPWECTLEPGDLLYFPNGWYHATINLDVYTAFVSTFTREHLWMS